MRKPLRTCGRSLGALALAVSVLVWTPSAATAGSDCNGQWRAWDKAFNYNSDGVRGKIYIPQAFLVSGYGHGIDRQSVADVYLYSSEFSGFVQLGWYVGEAGQLDYVNQPTIFAGESNSTGPGETLYDDLGTLSWGSSHEFRIVRENGKFSFYVSGDLVKTSKYTHTFVDDAAFNGETDNRVVEMYGLAAETSETYSTLQWRQSPSGNWHDFDDNDGWTHGYNYDSVQFTGEHATDLATGGGYGSCP